MTNQERAEKISQKPFPQRWDSEGFKQWVDFITSQFDEAVREAVDGLRLPDIMENCEAKGFSSAREKAAGIADKHSNDDRCLWNCSLVIAERIRAIEPDGSTAKKR